MSQKLGQNASSRSVDEVAAHLLEEEVDEEVVGILRAKGVDGPKLLALTEEKLIEMGVSKRKERTLVCGIVQKLSSSSQQGGIIRHNPTKDEGGFGLCGPHLLPLDYFCEKCDKLSCAVCVVEGHQGHTLLPFLVEQAGVLREELEGFVPKLGEQSAHIEKVLKECGAALEKLARTTALSIEGIVATREKLIKALHEASESAIAQVREHEAAKRAYLQRKVEENLALKKDMDSLRQDLSQFLMECSPSLVMQQRDAFKASCAELLGETKARSIAQLDAMKDVGVKVDENCTLKKILELIQGPLYVIAVHGFSELTGGILPLGLLVAAQCTRIVALGGNSGKSLILNTAELYDEATKKWIPLPDMLSKRGWSPAIGFSNNKIYVSGGFDGLKVLDSAEVLDLKWTALSSMRTKRCYTSGMFLADGLRFLVTGGRDDGNNYLSSCEVFDTASNAWTPVASLSGPRAYHCTVLYKGKPVVLGGSESYFYSLSTCEEYDHAANKWNPLPSFYAVRYSFGAAVVDGNIYIAGGSGKGFQLDSIEVFDGATWSMVSSRLASPRPGCAAVCFSTTLVVLGGSVETAEVYDPAINTVSSALVPKMKVNPKRKNLAAVSF